MQLIGGGTILREVLAAAQILERDYGVLADVWSLTSANELQREGQDVKRWNMLNPGAEQKVPYLTTLLADAQGPVIAATDYMKAYADQLREFVPGRFMALGTDGFGRSDTRDKLRAFFEVSRGYVVLASLNALVDEGKLDPKIATDAVEQLGLNPKKPNPLYV